MRPAMEIRCRELVIPFIRLFPNDMHNTEIWARLVKWQGLSRLSLENVGVRRDLATQLNVPTRSTPMTDSDFMFVTGRRLTLGLDDRSFAPSNFRKILVKLAGTAEFLSVRFLRPAFIDHPTDAVACLADMIHKKISRVHCELPITQTVGTVRLWLVAQ